MDPNIKHLTSQELIDWERWASRDVQWKPEDVRRLIASVQQARGRLHDLDCGVLVIPHGSDLYSEMVQLRYRVLREPLGLTYTQEQLDAEHSYLHLALIESGQIVACLYQYLQEPGVARVKQVAVDLHLQGKGFGRRIMLEAEKIAFAMGAERCFLHARSNVAEFYTRIGYEPVGEPFEEVGIAHQAMLKMLA